MSSSSFLRSAASVCVLLVCVTLSAQPLFVSGATLSVCPSGCPYALPSLAYAASVAGDTISVASGSYTDCIYITKDTITIVGTGATKPILTNKVCGGKGILVTAGRSIVLRNLELSFAKCDSGDGNCAGVRHDAAGFDLTLDNMYIHDCNDGLLGSASGDTVTITNSLFENNGLDGQAHNMYFGHHNTVVFRNSTSRSAINQGHELKSRAFHTIVDSSVIASLNGVDSRLIDCSNGGTLTVTNSVLENGPNSSNNNMIAYAPEGQQTTGDTRALTIRNNIFIGDRSTTIMLYLFATPDTTTVSGNTLVKIATPTYPAGLDTASTVYASRTAAGYPAFPWLPAVPGSTNGGGGGAVGGSSSTGSNGGAAGGSSTGAATSASGMQSSSSTGAAAGATGLPGAAPAPTGASSAVAALAAAALSMLALFLF